MYYHLLIGGGGGVGKFSGSRGMAYVGHFPGGSNSCSVGNQ